MVSKAMYDMLPIRSDDFIKDNFSLNPTTRMFFVERPWINLEVSLPSAKGQTA